MFLMLALQTLKKKYQSLKSDLQKLDPREIVALPAAVRAILAEPLSIRQAEEEVRRMLQTRAQSFLYLARTQVYEKPGNPYRKLLSIAGCEYADLEREVQNQGVEQTLEGLAGAGAYLTSEEYKGKKAVTRGRESFFVTPNDFECFAAGPG